MSRRSHNKRTRKMSIQEIVDVIKPDVLMGLNARSLSELHQIDIGPIMKALEILARDPEVIRYRNQKTLEKRNKEKRNRKKAIKVETKEREVEKKTTTSTTQHITDDVKIQIAADYESGNYKQQELVTKYNVSASSVSKIISSLIDKDRIKEIKRIQREKKKELQVQTTSEEVTEEEVVEHVEDVEVVPTVRNNENIGTIKSYINHTVAPANNIIFLDNTSINEDLVEIRSDDSYKTVGLVNNRHNLGVNTFIYNKIPNDKIFNFEWLEGIAKEFVLDTIKFNKNGIPTQGLIVKCTGLQTPLSSIVKVCYNMKINLIAAHYQIQPEVDLLYRHQPIFTDFPIANDVPYTLTHISNGVSRLYLYKSKAVDYNNITEFYELKIANLPETSRKNQINTKPDSTYSILARSIEEAIMVNAILSRLFLQDRSSIFRTVTLNQYNIEQNSALGYVTTTLQKSSI